MYKMARLLVDLVDGDVRGSTTKFVTYELCP